MSRVRVLLASQLLAVALLSGCAVGRTVIQPGIEPGQNPAQGMAVRIDSVQDTRQFAIKPPSPDVPSLMEDGDISNPAITSRAVARKRGGFGAALGDVVLPEGQTVMMLTQSAVARALRESGYRVIDRGSPGYEQAVPVAVQINQFWSWFSPGFAAVTLSFRGDLTLKGELPQIEKGRPVSAQIQDRMQAVFESDWQAIVNKGLNGLVAAIREVLQPAARNP